ncbi:MAG TPA: hypothetical protein VFG10_09075 [Saprospiraceae bacterium]|nr:hypothetical protein [Saprospiraceae bacterium]
MKSNHFIVCFFCIISIQVRQGWGQVIHPIESFTETTKPTDGKSPVYMHEIMQKADKHFQNTKAGFKQYKRMEYYAMSRLGTGGRLLNTTTLNYDAYQHYIESVPQTSSRGIAHNGHWTFLGPVSTLPHPSAISGGIGRVNRFGFHPTDPDIVFAATAGGGLWKTVDKGLHWESLSDGIPVMNTTGVAVDFVDPDILYLLSGDGDATGSFYGFNEFSRTSIGVFKTYDGGNLWQPTGLFFDETAAVFGNNLYMSPEDRLTLYACTNIGLFRTRDGGVTWDTIRSGLVYELEFKPGVADRIYCVDNNSFFVSDNGGDTWIDSTMIPAIDGKNGRMCITTCASNPNLVYLIASPIDTLSPTDTLPDHRGFWRSTNSGSDFTLISTRPNLLAAENGNQFKSQAYYDFTLECNPLNASQVIVGTIGRWKTIDSGNTWIHDDGINTAYHADIHSIQVNPLDNTLYMANDGGVFISLDFGEVFEFRSDFLAITQYYKIATSPFFTDYVMAGAQDNGIHLRDTVEIQFDHVVFGDGMESLFHSSLPSLALSTCQFGEVRISHDTGHTFVKILPPIDTTDGPIVTAWTTPLAFDALDTNVIYVGYKPIIKSTDQGQSFFVTSNDTISAHKLLVNNLSNPNRIYAGDCRNCGDSTITFEMYMSPDAGSTWERIDLNTGFPRTSFVTAAEVNPDNSMEIWITCGRYEASRKVFKSMDAGVHWTNETGSLPNVPVNEIVYEDNNGNPSGAVYVATDIGVFYRNDDLNDWIYFSNNLPRVEVTDLDIDYNGGLVRVSTYGRGLWESELYTSCQPTLSLNALNQPIGHSFVHQASQQIFSTARIDGYGSRVVYKSDGEIYLSEGFHATAKKGATFNGLLGPCNVGGIDVPMTVETPVGNQ